MKRATTRPKTNAQSLHSRPIDQKTTFIEHLQELRRRLFYIALSLIAGGAVAYNFHEPITRALLAPANGQQFIYTSPGGGFDFLFRICLYGGVVCSIPVILYQALRYIQPLMPQGTLGFVRKGAVASAFLALVGTGFGYLVGLPAALHFLLQGFSSDQITALITIQSYLSFVMMYLLATAILFQIPLILILINRIKPLRPSKIMRQQRWVVLVSFVVSAIISPTPDIQNLLMLSVPMIVMFQFGVLIVWLTNHKHRRPKQLAGLLAHDQALQAERQARFQNARAQVAEYATRSKVSKPSLPRPQKIAIAPQPAPAPVITPLAARPLQPARPVTRRTVSAPGQRPNLDRGNPRVLQFG